MTLSHLANYEEATIMLLNDILLCSKGIYLKNYKILVSYQNLSVQNNFLGKLQEHMQFYFSKPPFCPL